MRDSIRAHRVKNHNISLRSWRFCGDHDYSRFARHTIRKNIEYSRVILCASTFRDVQVSREAGSRERPLAILGFSLLTYCFYFSVFFRGYISVLLLTLHFSLLIIPAASSIRRTGRCSWWPSACRAGIPWRPVRPWGAGACAVSTSSAVRPHRSAALHDGCRSG